MLTILAPAARAEYRRHRMHDSSTQPRLSVVFVVRGHLANIQRTLECLLAQTAAAQIDFILSSDSPPLLREAESFLAPRARFARSRFLLHQTSINRARRLSAAVATGDVVAFNEDHCFPESNWAEELLVAFESSENIHAAAPVMLNPHPESVVSRAQFLLFHGLHGMHGSGPNPLRFEHAATLPWHNTAYRRSVLPEASDDEDLFQTESFLQDNIRAARPNARFVRCTQTSLTHVNMTRLAPALGHAFHAGRMYGSHRARRQGWGVPRKLFHFGIFPAIALLKLVRWASVLSDRNSLPQTLSTFSTASLLAVAHALGESVGACLGAGRSLSALAEFEFDRCRFLRPAEWHLLLADENPPQEHPAAGTECGSFAGRST